MAWRRLGSIFSFLNFRGISQQEGRMREVELGTHTIRSDGGKVAWDHRLDWLILLLLMVIEVILFVIHPFYRFVGKDMMTDLKYPLQDNTVPVWAVPMYAVLLPIAIFICFYIRRTCVFDLHHSVLGLLFAVLITAVITDAIKNATGRPRPDFFWRCFPDGNELYDKLGDAICHGKDGDVKEGHKSFPSGHASWSFAGLGFLSFYLSGKIKAFNRRGHVAKLCIIFLPLLVASLVAISRVDDYWHHWQDVFAGGILGLVVAGFCYRQFFPNPYDDDGWGPYEYFRALEETRANSNSANQTSALAVQAMDVHVLNQRSGENGDAFTSMSLDSEASPTLNAMELGRK